MKVLSIRNPQAYLLAFGLKDVENRTWTTDYRGTIQIHVSGDYTFRWPDADWLPESVREVIQDAIDRRVPYEELHRYAKGYEDMCRHAESVLGIEEDVTDGFVNTLNNVDFSPFVNSAIIGQFDLVDIVKDSGSPWAEQGCYHWITENNVAYAQPELGVKGKLRLWSR